MKSFGKASSAPLEIWSAGFEIRSVGTGADRSRERERRRQRRRRWIVRSVLGSRELGVGVGFEFPVNGLCYWFRGTPRERERKQIFGR
jgi:hypothetical protein